MGKPAQEEKRREGSLPPEPRPEFWQEVYWFVVICLGGVAAALLVLAPRLAEYRSTLELETKLGAQIARLDNLEKQYEAAIQALTTDPFYHEELVRAVLRVKKSDEEFLSEIEARPASSVEEQSPPTGTLREPPHAPARHRAASP